MNPEKLASRKRIAQGLKRDHTSRQAPIVFMRGSRGRGFFERRPPRLALAATHARAICETAKTDVQLLGGKAGGSNFSQVLQLEEHLAVGPFTITVNHRLAFFVVLRQRPRRDRLNVTRSKTGTAIGIRSEERRVGKECRSR